MCHLMWKCPGCEQLFYNKNQAHSCGNYSIGQFLRNKTGKSCRLFYAFLERYKEVGVYQLHPVKTRVALLTKIRFASINKLGSDYLLGHLVLTAEYREPVFYKIDNLNNRFYVHHFRLNDEKDISLLKKYMHLAYKVGMREHIS